MGYYLQAFICRQTDTDFLTTRFDKAVKINLNQGLDLIPMTEELYDQINNFKVSASVDNFEYLTENLEHEVLTVMCDKRFAYVEAEYHGGDGGQIAIIWNRKEREKILYFGQDRINQVLKDFGVIAESGQDEFLTLGFGLRRNTSEWLDSVA